jgi:hypothetical protein
MLGSEECSGAHVRREDYIRSVYETRKIKIWI